MTNGRPSIDTCRSKPSRRSIPPKPTPFSASRQKPPDHDLRPSSFFHHLDGRYLLSDLHLDHRRGRFELEEVEQDVMVCVGDVRGSIADGIEVLGKMSERPVVFIAGSHEFYGFEGTSLKEAYEQGQERIGKGGPVHLLENEALVLDGVRFLGTTLWTDYALYGEESQEAAMEVARSGLNDHRAIRLRKPRETSRAFLPSDALSLHHKAVQWLSGALSEPFDGPTLVCTHHGPHKRSVAAQFNGDLLSAAFVSHLPELVEGAARQSG